MDWAVHLFLQSWQKAPMECLHHPPGFLRIQCDPSVPNEYPIDSHFFHAVHVVFIASVQLILALYPVLLEIY